MSPERELKKLPSLNTSSTLPPTSSKQPSDSQEIEYITGYFVRIFFMQNNFAAGVFKLEDKSTIKVAGNFPKAELDLKMRLCGSWTVHEKFGKQFTVLVSEELDQVKAQTPPSENHGLCNFLASGIVKGIGEKRAEQIIATFGDETIKIIENEPERLCAIKGITLEIAQALHTAWQSQNIDLRSILIWLQSYDITPTTIQKIYNTYEEHTMTVLQTNPYRLAWEVSGIGFVKADEIALRMGMSANSEQRMQAGLLYTLEEEANNGHVYMPWPSLITSAARRLNLASETQALEENLDLLATTASRTYKQPPLVIEQLPNTVSAEPHNLGVWQASFWRAEKQIAESLVTLMRTESHFCTEDIYTEEILACLAAWERSKGPGFQLTAQQRQAVISAVHNKVLVITGGPGTGKTTILCAILHVFKTLFKDSITTGDIALAAPTGLAAKRMRESTHHITSTIHRLLCCNIDGHFDKNEVSPLDHKLVIIDETSMIDIRLMRSLLAAIRPTATVIFVGDVDQLPSVGPGTVLRDMIDSKNIPVITLETICRQAENSLIVTNAHAINKGQAPLLLHRHDLDFHFIEENDPENVPQQIVNILLYCRDHNYCSNPKMEVQVLSPMRKGASGTIALNTFMQALFAPIKPEQKHLNRCDYEIIKDNTVGFRLGDKVMQTRNDYKRHIMNGETGIVTFIDPKKQELDITRFDDNSVVHYTKEELDDLVLSYTVTIHKSQGSEYPITIIPLFNEHYIMLQRNLLYTAVTRARRHVFLIGTHYAIQTAVRNNKPQLRHTILRQRIVDAFA